MCLVFRAQMCRATCMLCMHGQRMMCYACCAGIMSAYASFAPATTNIWMDNNYIAGINVATSFFAGFAVFSVLGNMAHQQTVIAGRSADLRVTLCEENAFQVQCPDECAQCGGDFWMDLEHSVCCGNFNTRNGVEVSANVAENSFILAFSVRSLLLLFRKAKFSVFFRLYSFWVLFP